MKRTKSARSRMARGRFVFPEKADGLKTFLIDHDQVLGLLGKKLASDGKHYHTDLEPHLAEIESSAREAGQIEREKQDSFQQNVIELYRGLLLYRKLKNTLAPPPVPAESSETLDQIGVAEFFFDPEKIRTAPPSTNASVP